MVNINLLPWRKEIASQQKIILKRMLLGTVLCLFILLFGTHLVLTKQLQNLKFSITNLQAQYNPTEKINDVAEASDAQRELNTVIRELFHEIVNYRQTNVCLLEMIHQKNKFRFKGKARSVVDFLAYIAYLRSRHVFSKIVIEVLALQKNQRLGFIFYAI